MSRTRIHKFLGTLLEKGEWNQVEAEYLHEDTKPRDKTEDDKRWQCLYCKRSMVKGVINYNYMLKDEVWAKAGFGPRDLAHHQCVASLLCRELTKDDFKDVPMNNLIHWMFDNGIPLPKD